MEKKFWSVLDSDGETRIHPSKRGSGDFKFPTREEALTYAKRLAGENEADYFISEAVAVARTPKAPIEVVDILA